MEKSTLPVGKLDALSPQGCRFSDAEAVQAFRERGFNDLAELELSLGNRVDKQETSREGNTGVLEFALISLNQLGMVEAELIHQGILPAVQDDLRRGGGVLTFAATHEADLLTWYARRAGFSAGEFSFRIDLPRYLNERAHALLVGDSLTFSRFLEMVRLDSATRSHLPRNLELAYLNRFAGFLRSNQHRGVNRYQRGMNLVLKTLVKPQPRNPETLTEGPVQVTLPTTRDQFLTQLKAHRRKQSVST